MRNKQQTVYSIQHVRHLEIINPFPPSRNRQGIVVFNSLTGKYEWLPSDKTQKVIEAIGYGLSIFALDAMKILEQAR